MIPASLQMIAVSWFSGEKRNIYTSGEKWQKRVQQEDHHLSDCDNTEMTRRAKFTSNHKY